MKSVIYLEEGQFRIIDINDWHNLICKYKLKSTDKAKFIDIDLSLFNAICEHSLSRHAQNVLRELYYGY